MDVKWNAKNTLEALKGIPMSQRPYDYSRRKGIRPISWEDFHGIC